ncbi:MAG: hypothetical protein AAFO82_08170, partial [Bacteroidota bacterium]
MNAGKIRFCGSMVLWLKKYILQPYITITILTLIFACSDPPPPALLYEDRQVIDSLYQIEYENMVDSLDAACEEMLESQIEETVDSILKIRLVEIVKQKQHLNYP